MQDLIKHMAEKIGHDEELTQNALRIVVDFLIEAAPAEPIAALLEQVPEAQALATKTSASAEAAPADIFGGGVMATVNALTGLGLGFGEIQDLTKEFIAYCKEKADPQSVDEIVASIPELAQFI